MAAVYVPAVTGQVTRDALPAAFKASEQIDDSRIAIYCVTQPPIFADEQRAPEQENSNESCRRESGFTPR